LFSQTTFTLKYISFHFFVFLVLRRDYGIGYRKVSKNTLSRKCKGRLIDQQQALTLHFGLWKISLSFPGSISAGKNAKEIFYLISAY
jgi:hypothetical protein